MCLVTETVGSINALLKGGMVPEEPQGDLGPRPASSSVEENPRGHWPMVVPAFQARVSGVPEPYACVTRDGLELISLLPLWYAQPFQLHALSRITQAPRLQALT